MRQFNATTSMLAYSTNGIDNYTGVTNPSLLQNIASLAYGNGLFMYITSPQVGGEGDRAYTSIWISTDGKSWTRQKDNLPSMPAPSSIAYGRDLWVIGGHGSSDPSKNLQWSSDSGATWNESSGSDIRVSNYFYRGLAYDKKQKLWVATGRGISSPEKTFVWSNDGKNWSSEGVTGNFIGSSGGNAVTSRFS